jgi:UDP-3-O-[3-hydroxymyristoyl] glucosamine N-acyltransferase
VPAGVPLPSRRSALELAEEYGGKLDDGCDELFVRRVVAPEDAALDDDLVLVTSPKRLELATSRPGLMLVASELEGRVPRGRRWVHANALWVVARMLAPVVAEDAPESVPERAHIDCEARLHPSVVVRPGAVVLRGASVGEGSIVGENAVVYERVRIGARVVVGPLAVIGRQGFGFATGPAGEVVRVPQLGGVVVEDDVEIGACATVDAGTLGPTILRRGAKLDAHVHVGHNVEIGAGTLVAAQAGFAGSSRVGAGVLVGGQAGVKDHVEVGDYARIGAKSGVIGDVAPRAVVAGFPAIPRARWLRAWALLLREKRKHR